MSIKPIYLRALITISLENKVEIDLLKKDYEKIKNRYEKKYEGYQLKQKIYAALTNKGYKYQEIKKVLEDFTYEDDCGI